MQNYFFILPIYGHSSERYYKDKENKVVLEKRKIKDLWSKSSTNLQVEALMRKWESAGSFDIPPWKFNDIVGYLDIGMDGMTSLTADIYLKRKNFPRNHKARHSSYSSTLQNIECLYYTEINKIYRIDVDNNNSFVLALNEIIRNAKRVIKKRNKSFRLQIPPFDFKCINFVEAYRDLTDSNICK